MVKGVTKWNSIITTLYTCTGKQEHAAHTQVHSLEYSVLTLISVSVSPPVSPQKHVKDPGHSAKSAGGRLQLNTLAPYTWLYGVHRTPRDSSSFTWHQPCRRYKYITPADIKKTCYKKIVTPVKSNASTVSLHEHGE